MKKLINILFSVITIISVIALVCALILAEMSVSNDDIFGGLGVVIVAMLGFIFIYLELDLWLSVNRIIIACRSKNVIDIVFNSITAILAFSVIAFAGLYFGSFAVGDPINIMLISFCLLLGVRGIWFAFMCLKSDN